MKNYRFYLEFKDAKSKRKATRLNPCNHSGNVIATIPVNGYWVRDGQIMNDAIGALQDMPNSVCCGTSCSYGYLRERCIRISEKQARDIHPNLFNYLEQ